MYTFRNLVAFKELTFQTFYYVFICKYVCVSIDTHIFNRRILLYTNF